ncbi:MAG TPA: hypothetical protein VNH22_19575 [Blastocatellia bacterium]|jgi:hypothetical protein|nr:hypothetical protein [Blastocatellia bacterium]
MHEWMEDRISKLRDFFGLTGEAELIERQAFLPDLSAAVAENLSRHNIEWQIIPDAGVVPFDDEYARHLYPMCSRTFADARPHSTSCRDFLSSGHRRHQGRILGVETTVKPRYLPNNRQRYGTPYGFEATADPFARYLGRAAFASGARYGHNYASLREFINLVNQEWHARGLMPEGFRVTVCPPAVFNLIGAVFHREWSETESLELGFYRDEHGNAKCYAVGSNGPGDFSYIHEIESDSDWTLLGFRLALVPEE